MTEYMYVPTLVACLWLQNMCVGWWRIASEKYADRRKMPLLHVPSSTVVKPHTAAFFETNVCRSIDLNVCPSVAGSTLSDHAIAELLRSQHALLITCRVELQASSLCGIFVPRILDCFNAFCCALLCNKRRRLSVCICSNRASWCVNI